MFEKWRGSLGRHRHAKAERVEAEVVAAIHERERSAAELFDVDEALRIGPVVGGLGGHNAATGKKKVV